MFDRESAEKKVAELINADYRVEGDELVILSEQTIEREYGWIFFYDSKKYLSTRDFSDRLAGNGPIVFEKNTGLLHHLGSYAPPQKLIQEFEANRKARTRSCLNIHSKWATLIIAGGM